MIRRSTDGVQRVLSLSYGKDSLACLAAIEQLDWPLDRIIHAEIWATDTIPADLPPMVEFKKKADKIIKDRWGLEVEHVCATRERERESNSEESPLRKRTYENTFYEQHMRGKHIGQFRGFPMCRGGWCQDRLKGSALDLAAKANLRGHILSGSEAAQETDRQTDRQTESMDSQWYGDNGVRAISRELPSDHWVGNQMEPVLYGRTQERSLYGFPISANRGNWCTQLKTRVFF